ncbi:MAG: PIG-L family deacetylase [Bryobacteraceae bacterium]|nr:PIG-L family deacetylase [Bryobacteraceae bacterium]
MDLSLPSNYLDPVPEVDVLVIAAHPGDAELTSGGLLIQSAAAGLRTAILDLSPGDITYPAKKEEMLAAATEAAAILGLTWRGNLHYPDGRLENSLPARMTIAGEIRRLRPRVVIVPHPESEHPDHSATSLMAAESAFLCGLGRLDDSIPAHRPDAVYYALLPGVPVPATFTVNVAEQLEAKNQSLRCYPGAGRLASGQSEAFWSKKPLRLSRLPL